MLGAAGQGRTAPVLPVDAAHWAGPISYHHLFPQNNKGMLCRGHYLPRATRLPPSAQLLRPPQSGCVQSWNQFEDAKAGASK